MHGLFKSANTCMQPNTVSAQSGSTDACNQITLVAYIWPGQMQPGCLELAWLGWEGYQTRPKLHGADGEGPGGTIADLISVRVAQDSAHVFFERRTRPMLSVQPL